MTAMQATLGVVAASLVDLPSRLLAGATRRAAWLPIAAMALGLAAPGAASMLFPALPWIAATTVFCGLMSAEGGTGSRSDLLISLRLLPVLAVAAPAAAWWAGAVLGADPEQRAWMALIAAAPISAVAVANVGAMGFPRRPTTMLLLASTLAAPLVLPVVTLAVASGTELDPRDVAARAVAVVLLPGLLVLTLRGLPPPARAWWPARSAWTGLAAIAVTALALARMHGVGPQFAADAAATATAILFALLACGIGAALAALASPMIVWSAGWRGAALCGGCRGGALVYALVAPDLPPAGHLFMAATILPIYGLPILVALGRRRAP